MDPWGSAVRGTGRKGLGFKGVVEELRTESNVMLRST